MLLTWFAVTRAEAVRAPRIAPASRGLGIFRVRIHAARTTLDQASENQVVRQRGAVLARAICIKVRFRLTRRNETPCPSSMVNLVSRSTRISLCGSAWRPTSPRSTRPDSVARAYISRETGFLRPDLEFSAARDPRRWRVGVPHDAGFAQVAGSSRMTAAVATLWDAFPPFGDHFPYRASEKYTCTYK